MEIEIAAIDKIYRRIANLRRQIIRTNTEFEMVEATLRVFENESDYISEAKRNLN